VTHTRRAALRLAAALVLFAAPLTGAAPGTAPPEAPAVPAVVSGEWLRARLAAEGLVLLDARPAEDFHAAQLPGARSVAVEELRTASPGAPPVPRPPEVLREVFSRAGVRRGSHVVVYGVESDLRATYVATAARVAGAGRVSVLDGGFARWKEEGGPVTAAPEPVAAAEPDLVPDASFLVSIEEVWTRVADGRTVFLDVRPEAQYEAGHVPGAKNRQWKRDVAEGFFRPLAEIRAELEALGVSWERPVVVYCNSGNQATSTFHLLRNGLGHPDVRLFQGAWRAEPTSADGTGGAPAAAVK
jgi:thiosulfate/3-mercaptopyruvate sulfurtransferase